MSQSTNNNVSKTKLPFCAGSNLIIPKRPTHYELSKCHKNWSDNKDTFKISSIKTDTKPSSNKSSTKSDTQNE